MTLENSTNAPSPKSLNTRPPWVATSGSKTRLRLAFSRYERSCLVSLHEAAVADYIGGEDGGEFTVHDSKRERVAYLTRGSGVTEIIVETTCDPVR